MILAVQGSYQYCDPLRSLPCRERKLQLRSLLRKKRNIPFRYWFDPGDQALGKAIQLAVCIFHRTLLVLSPIIIEIDWKIAYMILYFYADVQNSSIFLLQVIITVTYRVFLEIINIYLL